MPKYINADQFERDCMFDRECEDMQDVIYKLRDYPAADVVEVVRCKDCKHKGESSDGYPMCMLFQNTKVFVELGHYCSRGERKETK